MARTELITCREIADVLMGNPNAVDAIVRDLTAKGVKIVRDWADRPAIAFADAERVVGAEIKKQRESYEQYLRDRELDAQVSNAQRDREDMAARFFSEEMKSRQGNGNDIAEATRIARKKVYEAENALPKAVRARLYWNMAIETRFNDI